MTPTPVVTPTLTPTPFPTTFAWLPLLHNEYFIPTYTPTPTAPIYKDLYCDDLSQPIYIPDNDPAGRSDDIVISDGQKLVNLSVYLEISHTYVGDLVVTLANNRTGEKIDLINRPGVPNSQYGCSSNNIASILDDAAAQPAENKCASNLAISGIFLPDEPLSVFSGRNINGTWRLNVSDHSPNDVGWLNHWCLQAFVSDAMPAPSPTPTQVYLPSSAYVYGMSGKDQQLNLDCESRSAVDWVKHYGYNIDELNFLSHLPNSDDPEEGFVGDPDGIWGQIPPNDYGVHAPPIADVLRDYGATANSFRSLQWNDLRAEIASGNPVIVWIIGGGSYSLVNGIPHFYTAHSTGNTTIVARYEHTVILVGYTPTYVTVLNGSRFVDVPLDQFLDSWSVMQFMAVLARP
jgi:subtilisin-like proprotein convertase family protein